MAALAGDVFAVESRFEAGVYRDFYVPIAIGFVADGDDGARDRDAWGENVEAVRVVDVIPKRGIASCAGGVANFKGLRHLPAKAGPKRITDDGQDYQDMGNHRRRFSAPHLSCAAHMAGGLARLSRQPAHRTRLMDHANGL